MRDARLVFAVVSSLVLAIPMIAIGQRPADSVVYASVFAAFYRGPLPTTIWLSDSTYGTSARDLIGAPGAVSRMRTAPGFPTDLVDQVAALISHRASSASLLVPNGVQIIPQAVHDTLGRTMQSAYAKRGPLRAGLFTLSPIAYSQDSATALVLFKWGACGPRCAEELAWVLSRQADGTWKVVTGVGLWSS